MRRPPGQAPTAWAAARSRTDPAYGHIYDHFAVEYEYPNGVARHEHVPADRRHRRARQRARRRHQGHGQPRPAPIQRRQARWRFKRRGRASSPYLQEHIDLIASIRAGKPLNEAEQIAESTLTAIMGRMPAYTGQGGHLGAGA